MTDMFRNAFSKPERFSFYLIAVFIILAGWLHLGPALLAGLFSYFALERLRFGGRVGKWLALALFIVLLAALVYALGYLVNATVRALPEIAERSTSAFIDWAREHQITLPFTDYDSLKTFVGETAKDQAHYLANIARFARGAASQFALVFIACVIAVGIFFQPALELEPEKHAIAGNLYSACCQTVAQRFMTFYRSFATVMGAQLVISGINTVLTGVFAFVMHLPYAPVIIGTTFFCGLLPIIGNLLSNTIIVGIGITVSPKVAMACLIFLIGVHKLEYFLNSKIVGDRIRNPFWLTLFALILGEKLMGVPGMVLAPVVLNYIKLEASAVKGPGP